MAVVVDMLVMVEMAVAVGMLDILAAALDMDTLVVVAMVDMLGEDVDQVLAVVEE
jgi:hypothetical protein